MNDDQRPMFTRRHYEAIAGAILEARLRLRHGEIGSPFLDFAIVKELVKVFSGDNPDFDVDLFERASAPAMTGMREGGRYGQ